MGDDEATRKKKEKHEKTVLKLFKAVSGIFTYTKQGSRMRRKLNAGVSYTVSADLQTNSETEADAATSAGATAVSEELKQDEDFADVTVEAPDVVVEEVDVVEIEEDETPQDSSQDNESSSKTTTTKTDDTPAVSSTTTAYAAVSSTIAAFVISLMAF